MDTVAEIGDGWGRARWRLRDLRGRDRALAAGMAVVALVPFVVALVRSFHDGWVPSGDEANIATRALDVFSRHPPLTGLPTTTALYGTNIPTNHPGPIEFYLLAIPLRVFGTAVGPLLTAATINAAFVLIALWVFFRRLGLNAMLWAGVLLVAVMWSGGTSVLADTVSSNMTMYSLLCTAVLSWALVDGDLRLLPLAAFVATYAAQQHLAAGLVVLALVGVAVVALGAQIVVRVRRGELEVKRSTTRLAAAAAGISAVCWAPVVDDALTGHPGNITAIIRFARDDTRRTLGLKLGAYQALQAVSPPTILGRTDTTGSFVISPPGAPRVIVGLGLIGALAVLTWWARRRSRPLAALAVVALVLLAAGIVDGSNVPRSFETAHINLYRWTWAAAFVAWAALGIGIALLVGRAASRSPAAARARALGPVALLVVAALIATAIVFVGGADDHNGERPSFGIDKRIAAAVLAGIDRHHPVLVAEFGTDAQLSVGPYVVLRLVEAGVTVEVSGATNSVATFGSFRAYRARSRPAILVLTSGRAQLPTGRGRLITRQPFGPPHDAQFDRLSARRSALVDDLARHALGVKVTRSAAAASLLKHDSTLLQLHIATQIAILPIDPRAALADDDFLSFVLAGGLRSPSLDLAEVRRLRDLPATRFRGIWGDEQVEARLLPPGQLLVPQIAAPQ